MLLSCDKPGSSYLGRFYRFSFEDSSILRRFWLFDLGRFCFETLLAQSIWDAFFIFLFEDASILWWTWFFLFGMLLSIFLWICFYLEMLSARSICDASVDFNLKMLLSWDASVSIYFGRFCRDSLEDASILRRFWLVLFGTLLFWDASGSIYLRRFCHFSFWRCFYPVTILVLSIWDASVDFHLEIFLSWDASSLMYLGHFCWFLQDASI